MQKFVAIIAAATAALGLPPFASAQPGKATGTLTVDGTTTSLTQAVRTTTPNAFDELSADPVIVLSNRPLTPSEASDAAALSARVRTGELVTMALRFDGRTGRDRLFNVAIRHAGAADAVLLPDVFFEYSVKGGVGTLTMKTREFNGHTYASVAEFSVPVPKETTDAPAAAERPRPGLPPPSKTDADRRAAAALLIETLQEGDEARALEVLKLGVDPNLRDAKMSIPVVNWAVLMCQPLVVKGLVDLKADLSHERIPGMTLLGEATAACPDAVPFLKAGGAK